MSKATIEVIEGRKVMTVDSPIYDIEDLCEQCCFGPLPTCRHIPCIPGERADDRSVIYVELTEEPQP